MKILIVRTYPSVVNVNNYNVQEIGLAKAFVRKGHQCDIVFFTDTISFDETYKIDEKKSIHIFWKKGKKFLCQGIYNFKELVELTNQYDAVQVNEYNQIASFIIVKRTQALSLIYHGPYKNKYDIKIKIIEKTFDLFFLNSLKKTNVKVLAKSVLAENTLRKKGFKNVKTVGVGLDTDRLGEKISVKKEKHTLLYIGEISQRRNTLFLLKVFKEVKRIQPNTRLILIGKGKNSYVEKCRKFLNQNGLLDDVLQIKSVVQKDLSQYYALSDIFLFPSNYDIFGMVLLEAMYFGVPIISSENGGANTLIKSINDGIVISKFDVNEWTNAIIRLLKSEKARKQIGNSGIKKIQQNFNWDSIADKFMEAYKEFE